MGFKKRCFWDSPILPEVFSGALVWIIAEILSEIPTVIRPGVSCGIIPEILVRGEFGAEILPEVPSRIPSGKTPEIPVGIPTKKKSMWDSFNNYSRNFC